MLDWSVPGKKYYEMVIEHMHLAGMKALPIVTRKDHPQQYREWYAYFGFRKMPASQELMRDKDLFTVPTLSPFDFDVAFSLNKAAPEVPKELPPSTRTPPFIISQERHRAMNAHLPILFENIDFDTFKRLSRDRKIPVGAKWVAALSTIFGPLPKSA